MTKYLDKESAEQAGYELGHDRERSQFTVVKDGEVLGVAHYRLLGDDGIDFDHTFVDPKLRGTGLASVLVRSALTDESVRGREINASCWFVAGYLDKHPELRGSTA